MGVEENREVARRYFAEMLSAPSDPSFIDQHMAEDVVFFGPITAKGLYGRAHYHAFLERWTVGFPDRHFEPEESVAEGDTVAMRFTITGTHQGEFMKAPPTGNRIEIHGINLFRFANGQLKEIDAFFNPHDLLGPIGLDQPEEIEHPEGEKELQSRRARHGR